MKRESAPRVETRVTQRYGAPPERVFDAWIDPAVAGQSFKAANTAEFTFRPEDGRTVVTWTMFGTNNFMAKAINLVINCDRMAGGQFGKGLANMRAVVEAAEPRS